MKKLYRKGTVHPSPPPPVSNYLSFLPAAILTLAFSLSPDDREVLAYLISCSSARGNTQKAPEKDKKDHHSPVFSCDCFGCYTSYWARWDTSPNRQLIHEIIDAFEDGLASAQRREKGGRRENKKKKRRARVVAESTQPDSELPGPDSVGETSSNGGSFDGAEVEEDGGGGDDVAAEGVDEKGSVRKLVSFIGEKFWGVWT